MATLLEDEKSSQSLMEHIILGVAHELNNPNTFVRVNAMNMKKLINMLGPCFDEYEKNHPDAKFGPYNLSDVRGKLLQVNESILGATVRIITIADKLKQCCSFALSQSSAISLGDLLKSVVSMHQFLLDRCAQIEFVNECVGDDKINGHQLQLEQALSIFMTNACDAISEKFKGQEKSGSIKILLSKNDNDYVIKFRDNGSGMDAEVMAKIFAPYFTTKPQGVGDGIGLSLCKSIIERHGGKIGVASQKNEWTEFTVTLPIQVTEV